MTSVLLVGSYVARNDRRLRIYFDGCPEARVKERERELREQGMMVGSFWFQGHMRCRWRHIHTSDQARKKLIVMVDLVMKFLSCRSKFSCQFHKTSSMVLSATLCFVLTVAVLAKQTNVVPDKPRFFFASTNRRAQCMKWHPHKKYTEGPTPLTTTITHPCL